MDDKSLEGKNTGDNGSVLPATLWRRSSFCGSGGHCVEVAYLASGHIGVRDSKSLDDDSKSPNGPVLRFTPEAWTAFVEDVRKDRSTKRMS